MSGIAFRNIVKSIDAIPEPWNTFCKMLDASQTSEYGTFVIPSMGQLTVSSSEGNVDIDRWYMFYTDFWRANGGAWHGDDSQGL